MIITKRISTYITNIIKFGMFYVDIKLLSEYIVNNNMHTKLSNRIEPGKEIVIYGFGPYGQEYFIKTFSYFKIKGIYDLNYKNIGWPVSDPEKITLCKFDYILVTVMEPKARNSVIIFLKNKGISEEKIVFSNYSE